MTAGPKADEVARRLIILKYQVVQALVTQTVLTQSYEKWSPPEQQKFRIQVQQRSDELCDSLRKIGLWDFLTDYEVKFFQTNPVDLTKQQIINASWRTESAMTLMWALEIIPELLPFDYQSSPDLLKQIPHQNLSTFIVDAKLMAQDKIEKKRSLAELWHWRSRTRELIESGVKPDILGERSLDDVVRTPASIAHKRGDLPNIIDEDFAAIGKAYRNLTEAEWSSMRSIATERHFALNWLCGYARDHSWDETPTDT